jgi:hypothetical protein
LTLIFGGSFGFAGTFVAEEEEEDPEEEDFVLAALKIGAA